MTHRSPAFLLRGIAAWWCCFALLLATGFGAEAARQKFNIPATQAEKSLKMLSAQSGRQVLFPSDAVKGIRTNGVAGEMTAADALGKMLVGTALVGIEDDRTGALTVRRSAAPSAPGDSQKKNELQAASNPPPMKRSKLASTLAATLGLLAGTRSQAAEGNGAITGHVFNPATGEYVRNAEVSVTGTNLTTYSAADGSYSLSNVPAGEVKLSVIYTGYKPAAATVNLAPGQTATRDFELQGLSYLGSGRGAAQDGQVVRLNQFVVSSEREGNAKAIMEQRASLNVKNVVASDNFGDITGGQVGEFLKYLPGVVMDTNEYGDPSQARLGGLDSKYASVNLDGTRMASGAEGSGATAREFDFNLISITSIESIEVNKTSTASMDADSPAGSINLRSKNAFERKGREITIQTSLTGNTYALSLNKTPGPYCESTTHKVLPGVIFNYSDVFFQRVGLQLNLAQSGIYTTRNQINETINYGQPARGPLITGILFQEAPRVTDRSSAGVSLDFKIAPWLILSLNTTGSYLHTQNGNFTFQFSVNQAQVDPSSTLTNVIARPTANTNTALTTSGQQNDLYYNTVTHTGKLELKRGRLSVTAGGSYSLGRSHFEDVRNGFFMAPTMRLSRMSWQAVRSSPRSSDWQMTQLSGRPWSDIASFGRDDLFPNNINSYNDAGGRGSQNQMFTGYVDGKTTLNLGLPVTLQSGWKTRLSTYERRSIDYRLTYVGPTGNSLDPAAVYIEEPLYRLDLKQGTNVESLNLPSVNRAAMYRLYVEHPNYFQTDPFTNFVPTLAGRGGSVKEQTDAGYVEGTSKWKDFRFNLGVRLERTRTVVRTIDIRPPAAVRAAGFTPNTIPFAAYQYRYGERTSKYGDYDNAFWSGGIKYSPTRSLTFQFGASQAIRRQDYAELGGNVVIDDVNRVITLPNPALKPETSDKYFAAAQYYLEPSGVLSLSGYQLQVANLGTSRSAITAAEAGYADDPEYAGYAFQQSLNLSGIRKIQGVELEYSQQLVFLPGVFRGLSVFGSVTRVASDVQVVRLVPKAASGGIRFSNHRFNVQLRATWQAASATTIAPTNTEWVYERLTFDLSSGIKLNNTYDFTLTGRNISNAPKQSYSNEPGRIAKSAYFGAVWTIGLRGKF